MESEFWHERWQRKEIGFHQDEANAYLLTHWQKLDIPQDASVFVPLCGKSKDMLWLADRGHKVLGVELSEIAVREFFDEAGLNPEITKQNNLILFKTPQISIYCGDFFDLQPKQLKQVRAVYDRAALIALPEKMRQDYVACLRKILPPSVSGLLVTMEYDEEKTQGPPFSVRASEVRQLYNDLNELAELGIDDIEFRNTTVQMRIWKYACP